MKISMHALVIDSFVPMLGMVTAILEKGVEHANTMKFDPAVLLNARLAPDMFPLKKQVQFACAHASDAALRLMGEQAPPPPYGDDAPSFDDLNREIAKTIAFIQGGREAAFDGADERRIVRPLRGDRVLEMDGLSYLRNWSLPNFYFHVVTAYDILRHNGVNIGKIDFMRHVAPFIRQT